MTKSLPFDKPSSAASDSMFQSDRAAHRPRRVKVRWDRNLGLLVSSSLGTLLILGFLLFSLLRLDRRHESHNLLIYVVVRISMLMSSKSSGTIHWKGQHLSISVRSTYTMSQACSAKCGNGSRNGIITPTCQSGRWVGAGDSHTNLQQDGLDRTRWIPTGIGEQFHANGTTGGDVSATAVGEGTKAWTNDADEGWAVGKVLAKAELEDDTADLIRLHILGKRKFEVEGM